MLMDCLSCYIPAIAFSLCETRTLSLKRLLPPRQTTNKQTTSQVALRLRRVRHVTTTNRYSRRLQRHQLSLSHGWLPRHHALGVRPRGINCYVAVLFVVLWRHDAKQIHKESERERERVASSLIVYNHTSSISSPRITTLPYYHTKYHSTTHTTTTNLTTLFTSLTMPPKVASKAPGTSSRFTFPFPTQPFLLTAYPPIHSLHRLQGSRRRQGTSQGRKDCRSKGHGGQEEEDQEEGRIVRYLHLQGPQAGSPGYWYLHQGHVHPQLVCFRQYVAHSSRSFHTYPLTSPHPTPRHTVFERIASEASKLATYNARSTITSREIQTAVRLILPGELSKHAISEGTKSVAKFSSSK
jgi:hypothetical protein